LLEWIVFVAHHDDRSAIVLAPSPTASPVARAGRLRPSTTLGVAPGMGRKLKVKVLLEPKQTESNTEGRGHPAREVRWKQLAGLGRIDGHLRRRMRAILLKQWKRKRHIVNQLVGLGVPAPLACVDIYVKRRSWCALSEKRAVCRGLTNEYFERRGLYTLHAHWQEHHERIWNIGPEQPELQPG
jgi:hypothetical protein